MSKRLKEALFVQPFDDPGTGKKARTGQPRCTDDLFRNNGQGRQLVDGLNPKREWISSSLSVKLVY
jgi:hypothetical protein